jgi:hypothetical protein
MSRIILSRYDDGQECVVVGWDHPGQGCWWQEFNREHDEEGRNIWEYDESWEEVKGYGGYMKGIPRTEFKSAVPEHIRPLITEKVMRLINAHSMDPNSGRIAPVDLSGG